MLRSASRKELLLPQDQRQERFNKLLRSQTVEGYAARHTNFTKLSGRALNNKQNLIAQTLPSPPFRTKVEPDETRVTREDLPVPKPPTPIPTDDEEDSVSNPFRQKRISFLKASGLDGNKEECVAELLTAIKTVLQDRLVNR